MVPAGPPQETPAPGGGENGAGEEAQAGVCVSEREEGGGRGELGEGRGAGGRGAGGAGGGDARRHRGGRRGRVGAGVSASGRGLLRRGAGRGLWLRSAWFTDSAVRVSCLMTPLPVLLN